MALSSALTGDLSLFFNSDEFAKNATYNGVTAIKVIFDDAYSGASLIAASVDDTAPQCLAIASTIPSAKQGDTLLIGSVTYNIKDVQPDGTGIVRLILGKD